MSEQVEQTQTSFAEALGKEGSVAPIQTPESQITESGAVETPQLQEPAKETAPQEPAPSPAPQTQPESDKAVSGVLKGIQAERRKRQQLERELSEMKQRISQYETPAYQEPQYTDAQVEQPESKTEMRILSISESSARASHPDYQEKFEAFYKEATQNPQLYQMVINSDHPGESAYQAGKTLLIQQKYGVDFDTQYSKIKEELTAELTPKLRAEIEAQFTGKVQSKLNQPTNILQARNAGDGGPPPFRPTSFADVLGRKRG